MYKRCWIVLNGIFYIGVIDFALSQQKGLDKSVNLALETVFEFDKDGKSDIQLLNNVQKFIGKVKNVLEKKHIERRQTGTDQRNENVFTNFILNIVNILNKFEDNDLEKFFAIINNEIQSYCDKDDDIHILNKLSSVGNIPAYIIRWYLNAVTNKIEEEAYFEDEKVVIDGVNNILKQDDTTKFDKFLNNLENYRRKSRRNINLVQVIKLALRNIFLHSYYHLKPSTRTVVKTILHHYFGSFISVTTKYPVFQQLNSVKRAKSKTTKEYTTFRQMYVEKNLDLKYPNDYVPVTKKHKRKGKTRSPKLRVMTVPTTRARTKSSLRKGKKHRKHTENSDDETTIIKTTKMINEHIYKRDFNKKYDKPSNQYTTSKEYDEDEEKYREEHRNLNKLSTFYVDLKKITTASKAQQMFDTHKYERPVVRPIGFSISIKNGNRWNSPQKVKKSKHYGYIQKERINVFSNERQMRMKKKDLKMLRMPPISLNMQLSMTKEPSILENGAGNTTLGADYIIYRNQDVKNPLSEEGLSIEGFQETKLTMYNRRSNNNNDTANNTVLNLIQKIEQDLEVVKTKIQNVSVFKHDNNFDFDFDDILKITENDVNKLKAGINMDKIVNQKVINVSKFYKERDGYDVEDIKKNLSFPDEKVMLKTTGVNKAIYMAARKTIYDQNILEKTLLKQIEHDSKEILNVIGNNIPINKESSTENSITATDSLNEKAKNENHENTTNVKVSTYTKVNEYLNNISKDKTLDYNKGTETLPNFYTNVKLIGDTVMNNQNTKKNANKPNILIEPNKTRDGPKVLSQMDEINNVENVTLKQITTTKSDIMTTLVTNYKNTAESGVTVDNFMTSRKVTDDASNEKKIVVIEIDRPHVGIINNNVTIIPKLDKLKEMSTTDIKKG